MEFKYQKIVSDKSAVIAKVKSSHIPLLVEYYDQYVNNQVDISTDSEYDNSSGLTYTSGTFVLQSSDITTDKLLLTTKIDIFNNKLYHQYQLKYDVLSSQNIRIFDEDGEEVTKNIEYGYVSTPGTVRGSALSLDHNKGSNYDTLDFHSRIGSPLAAAYTLVEGLEAPGTYDNLPFNIYGYCLSGGSVTYDSSYLNSEGSLEFYLVCKTISDGQTKNFIWSDNWRGYFENSGGNYSIKWVGTDGVTSAGISISTQQWMRVRIDFSNNRVRILNGSGSNQESVNFDINDFILMANDSYIFGLMFSDSVYNISWDLPLYAYRYSKALFWSKVEPDNEHKRVRLLFPDKKRYIVQYDGVDRDGTVYKNKTEWCSLKELYKVDTQYMNHDWSYNDVDKITFDQSLADDCRLIRNESGLDKVKIYITRSSDEYVSSEIINDQIVVTNGIFQHDNYSQAAGITDYYHVPEYDDMYFAADNQGIMEPKKLKNVKRPAEVLDSHTIYIGDFIFHEGFYPNYTISNTIDKTYNPKTGEIENLSSETILSYINARGINLYRNGALIDNSYIVNYDFDQGLIELSIILDSKDKITVTYLQPVKGYVALYPRLDRKSSDITYNSFRIYLRADYPNRDLDFPTDSDDRLVYRCLSNGKPIGQMRLCSDDSSVQLDGSYFVPYDGTDHPHYKLMDITMLEAITIEDIRELGGGIKEDDHFGSKEDRLKSFPFSDAYLNIVNADGYKIPYSVTFIKIDSTTLNNLISTYRSNGKTRKDAMTYLKQHIEKHLAAGVFYIIIDENGNAIDNPYPSTLGGNK